MIDHDFSGWATRVNVRCSDGRTILKDAFKDCDGVVVPLVWNHSHNDATNVLGHAYLENRDKGVYTYAKFNNTEAGKHAKEAVENGDIVSLSIYANRLKQQGQNVVHGIIREVSLVLAGANPEAFIDNVIKHGEKSDDEAEIFFNTKLFLAHSDDEDDFDDEDYEDDEFEDDIDEDEDYEEDEEEIQNEEEDVEMYEDYEDIQHADGDKTIADVFNEFTDEQKTVVYALIGQALEDAEGGNVEHSDFEEGDVEMNVFDRSGAYEENALSHADEEAIIELAKKPGVGSLKEAMSMYAEDNATLAHAFDTETLGYLFPEYKNLGPAAPEFIERDQSWVGHVMSGVHKSPITRIRTRQMDIRDKDLRALGYTNREIAKKFGTMPKLLQRTTDPQTVYRKDSLHRDDIIDITDFDIVSYQYQIMKQNMNEELALAFLIGDGRDDLDEDKIKEDHIRSIWHDEELYTIHHDVDIAAMKNTLQGTNTNANFGEEYIYAEAIIKAALFSREKYKGSGNLEFYCTPHLLNIMLLARDLNGRRIYASKSELTAALNVSAIHTVEQFEGKTRVDGDGHTKKLLGLFVNLNDYQVGATKGGELTKFEDFDIDFNKYKYLIETRLSGALTKVFSAIALEEPVAAE